jgi:hypothetical protein
MIHDRVARPPKVRKTSGRDFARLATSAIIRAAA